MTNKKLHARFRLVPKSMTLDDLERPFRTLFQNTCVFGAHHKTVKMDSYCQWQRCSAMTVVSGNISMVVDDDNVPTADVDDGTDVASVSSPVRR